MGHAGLGKRKVAYITGTRADYGLMRTVLRRIEATRKLSLSIIATGMHLSREFGYTIKEIERDGFDISARVPSLRPEDTGAGMLQSFSTFLSRLVDVVADLRPNIILLLGDRWEMLAGAMAGSYMNTLVAHIHGGEFSGSIDESNRHVITRFAHLHLVATQQHARVLLRLGEERHRIHVVGSPGLDDIVSGNYAATEDVVKKYHIDRSQPHILLVQHPVVTEREWAGSQMKRTLDAILRMGVQTTAIYPNADAGGREMIEVLRAYSKRHPFIQVHRSIPRDEYLGLMACANAIVGNSSSGIIEASSFNLPAVNIGTRQQGRIHPANVLDVDYDSRQIAKAIQKGMSRTFSTRIRGLKNPYGNGHTATKVARILARTRPTTALLQKKLAIDLV